MLISCKDLTVGYEKPIASNISFSVNEGDYLYIIGENGAGKSTLIKTLAGLIPPLSGEIERNIEGKIGYLAQVNSVQKDFPISAMEVVLGGLLKPGKLFYSKKDKETALEAIKRAGMEGFEKESFKSLSGGQKQKILLARALCATENLLILDEPVTGLDEASVNSMYEILEKLNKDGLTIITISHDMESVPRYASHVLTIAKTPSFATIDEYKEALL